MNNLIKNELTKIFKKKSIFITFAIIILFMLFINIMNSIIKNNIDELTFPADNSENIQNEMQNPEKNNPENYVRLKAELKIAEMKKKYEKDSWQVVLLDKKIVTKLSELELAKLEENLNKEEIQKLEKEYQEAVGKLDSEDWKYFAQEELKEITQKVNEEKELLGETQKGNTGKKLRELEAQEQVAKWRVEKEIKYAKDYLNKALFQYESSKRELENLKEQQSQEFSVKQQIQKAEKQIAELKYSIENNQEIASKGNSTGMLLSFFENYGIFIIIIVIMIAGSIVSEEFNRGTIKLLLVRPYKRSKILLSKLITLLIITVITILSMAAVQIVIGGIIFGWDFLQLPALIYNFGTQTIETMNVFQYFVIQALCYLPIYILLGTLSFTIGVVFCNTSIAIVIPLLVYMVGSIINQIVISYNIISLQYLVTLNWDLSCYIGGGLGLIEGLTMGISAVVCVIYFLIMIAISFIVFKKKDIKNV